MESIVLGGGSVGAFGWAEQVARYAAPAASGELVITAALAEADGSDQGAPSCRAERAGAGWRLAGVKSAVPAGASAGLFLSPAATGAGVGVFCVPPEGPGVAVEPQRLVDGAGAAQVSLADVELGPDRLIGETGEVAGDEVMAWLVARATVGLCALQLGVTERALELTAEYARNRQQFGRALGAFQAGAPRRAEAYIAVEAIRVTLWRACSHPSDPRAPL